METNKRTCLYDKHVALGALISPFGGFDMPIQYSGIVEEHNAVRQHCGVFDVSHMGEVTIKGPDAEKFVNHIVIDRKIFAVTFTRIQSYFNFDIFPQRTNYFYQKIKTRIVISTL